MEENRGSKLTGTWSQRVFVNLTLKAGEVKKEKKWMRLHQTKASAQQKKQIITKTKRQPNEWDEVFANYISDKGLIFIIYKEL